MFRVRVRVRVRVSVRVRVRVRVRARVRVRIRVRVRVRVRVQHGLRLAQEGFNRFATILLPDRAAASAWREGGRLGSSPNLAASTAKNVRLCLRT